MAGKKGTTQVHVSYVTTDETNQKEFAHVVEAANLSALQDKVVVTSDDYNLPGWALGMVLTHLTHAKSVALDTNDYIIELCGPIIAKRSKSIRIPRRKNLAVRGVMH